MHLARRVACVMVAVAVGVSMLCSAVTAADEAAIAAKAVYSKYAGAVVKVSMVFKTQVSMEGRAAQNEESKAEIIGTIIDPSGLTVMSLYQSSPEEQFRSMAYDEKGIKLTAETTDVKIRLGTGQELPAKIVLRSEDLDLTFIRPAQKPAAPLPYVDLAQSCKVEPLDQIVNLDRLGKVAGRAAAVSLDRVLAVIEKPRTFYVPANGGSLGSPVFSLDGKIAGIMISRRLPASAGSDSAYGSYDDTQMYVALPAEDILETAKQAPDQAIPEPKPAPSATPPAPAPAAKPASPAKPAAPAKPGG